VGYVLASVAELVAGEADRSRVRCDYGDVLQGIVADVGATTELALLRAYWYDASLSGQPEYDQKTVADLQGVRLRLGRLVRGEQKGVDSRIVRDLIVLAWDKAIAEAYLLAGDEDLCEGVQEAQDHGVRVVVLGVPGVNQSPMLVQQADSPRELPESFWRSLFQASDPVTGTAASEHKSVTADARIRTSMKPPSPVMQKAWREAVQLSPSSGAAQLSGDIEAEEDYETLARKAGQAIAGSFMSIWNSDDLRALLKLPGWQVPPDQDRWLLRGADAQMNGVLWERPELKPAVRSAFKDACRAANGSAGD